LTKGKLYESQVEPGLLWREMGVIVNCARTRLKLPSSKKNNVNDLCILLYWRLVVAEAAAEERNYPCQ
jgi:hypothetical protein